MDTQSVACDVQGTRGLQLSDCVLPLRLGPHLARHGFPCCPLAWWLPEIAWTGLCYGIQRRRGKALTRSLRRAALPAVSSAGSAVLAANQGRWSSGLRACDDSKGTCLLTPQAVTHICQRQIYYSIAGSAVERGLRHRSIDTSAGSCGSLDLRSGDGDEYTVFRLTCLTAQRCCHTIISYLPYLQQVASSTGTRGCYKACVRTSA